VVYDFVVPDLVQQWCW